MAKTRLPSSILEARKLSLKAQLRTKATAVKRLRTKASGKQSIARYATDPIGFCVDVLGVRRESLDWSIHPAYAGHEWDGTPNPLKAALDALAMGKSVGVESATGVGKTYLAACVVMWFLSSFEDSIVVTVAPKEKQLKLHLWKEVGRQFPAFKKSHPDADLIDLKLRMRAEQDVWSAVGFPVGVGAAEHSATRAQGFHAEHMLIIYEETPGIHAAVMTAFDNTAVAPHNLHFALGNPDHQLDQLHSFCSRPNVESIRISGYDHPNVVCNDPAIVPGATTRVKLDERLMRFGAESPLYLSRCRGICPTESESALIKLSWCYTARDKWNDMIADDTQAPKAIGLDVANSFNGDKAARAFGRGACLISIEDFQCPNANEMGRREAIFIRENGIDPGRVGVDSVGVGVGTLNELRDSGLAVQSLNGGSRPVDLFGIEEKFISLRAQMWWELRKDLQAGNIALPNDEELFADLTTPTWGTRGGKIWVEPKEDMIRRLGHSPNKGDAVVYWNWVRQHGVNETRGVTAVQPSLRSRPGVAFGAGGSGGGIDWSRGRQSGGISRWS